MSLSDSGDTSGFKEKSLTIREHNDPDKHWIGESLAPPSQTEIASTVGSTSGPGDSPFVARADHTHKLDVGFFPVFFYVADATAFDATTSAAWVTWLVSGNTITVPTWATYAIIQVNITNIYMTTAASTTYLLDATIFGGSYVATRGIFAPAATSERMSLSYTAYATGFGTGAGRDIRIGAYRNSGTGVMRHDGSSRTSGFILFKSAA